MFARGKEVVKVRKFGQKLMLGLAVGISCIILQSSSTIVHASSILDAITSEETTEDHSEDTSYSILRGNHLNFGMAVMEPINPGNSQPIMLPASAEV